MLTYLSTEEVDGWVDVMERMPPASTTVVEKEQNDDDFVPELRSIIEEADCDPGIIRKVMAGRSLPPTLADAALIRSIVWPALLGVSKRDVGEIEASSSELLEKVFKQASIEPEAIPVAILFCQSRGIELAEPIGAWVHLLKPIGALGASLSRQYTILHPIATRMTPHTPVALKAACDAILLLLQYHEPRLSQRLSDLRLDVTKAFSPLLSSLFSSSNSPAIAALWDALFQINDPILAVFLITVLVINCGADEGLSQLKTGDEFLALLTGSLDQIEEDDVGDFIDLAIQYRDLTPRTYLEEKISPLFSARPPTNSLAASLCIEVSPSESILRWSFETYIIITNVTTVLHAIPPA